MKKKNRIPRSDELFEQDLHHRVPDEMTKGQGRKKKTLMEKLDILSVEIKDSQARQAQLIDAISHKHAKLADDLQRQVMALKENLSGPEKKKWKKGKLADALADLQKSGRKLCLKPELGRTKDLDRIEDFFLKTYRVLDAFNDKFMGGNESDAALPY